MGTYNKGILGPFSGKVGTVVGASWRGKDVMRSLPKKTDRTPTEVQMLQRLKFTTVSDFLTPMSNVISLYFGSGSGELTRRNQAMSYHMKEAVSYADPVFEILYNKVLISKGDLTGVQNPAVAAAPTNKLLRKIKPHQVYCAGDLADPHGTHRVCLEAVFEALRRIKAAGDDWVKDCCVS